MSARPRGANRAKPGVLPINITAETFQRQPPSRTASSVRSPGVGGDDEEGDERRSRSSSARAQRTPNVKRLTDITKTTAPRSPVSPRSETNKGKRKPLKVKDCLKQMMIFVEKHDLKRILGENLTKKQLRRQLLPQARIAAKLPINLNYVNRELVMNLAVLSLYDLAVLIDDSVSMEFEEAGKRKLAVKHVLEIIAEVYGAVSEKKRGIRAIRFFNGSDDLQADNIQTREQIDKLIDSHVFEGLTRIGTSLMQKILKPFVFEDVKWEKASKQARKLKKLERPLLIMVITDGSVEGEPPSRLRQAIQSVADSLREASFDLDIAKAIVFQFARVGNDRAAQRFLEHLDTKSQVKDYVDTLWGEDLMGVLAKEEHQQRMMKLLLGPISSIYDEMESKKVSVHPDGFDSADDFDDDEENDEDFEDFDSDDGEEDEDDEDYDEDDDDEEDDDENGGGADANQTKANQRQGNQGRANQRHSTGDDGFDDTIDS